MNKKNLVLYFSAYGTAKKTAEEIAKQTGADLVEIEPVHPEIKNEIDISGYDNIFIGYPIWWYTLPMIMYTLFDKYDFTGKNIIPFNTHMGSGDGGTYRTIKELEPGATILKGLPLEMKDAEAGNPKKVSKWLESLGF
jgi:flavodoxin